MLTNLPGQLAALLALGAILLTSCSQSQTSADSTGILRQQPAGSEQVTGVLPATDLAVGPNQRFLLVLIAPDNSLVSDATVDLSFFKVTGANQAQLRAQAVAQYREAPGATGRGAYIARADFDEAGQWGVAAHVTEPGKAPADLKLSFEVKDKSSTPSVGAPVPASRTLTGTSAAEIERFSSARPVDTSLYRVSIADALQERKPLVVLFASPGFCTSRLCGPSLEALQSLRDQYDTKANFMHVEIYQDGRPNANLDVVPPVREWGLTSEPWLFVVGPDGRLADKFEGSIVTEEVRQSLDPLVQDS